MELLKIGPVDFPPPTGLNVNMMPFVMGDPSSIPAGLSAYIPLIEACGLGFAQYGHVGYLSVMESTVQTRSSQRRPGIHTEAHCGKGWGGGWGSGSGDYLGREDGLYMASTVADSCRAWNATPSNIGTMGDCEHLRSELELLPSVMMEKDTLYWMTDRCPHESLPLRPGTFRQWFRLVTHKVDLWYRAHSTANPLGITAPCSIVQGNKFGTQDASPEASPTTPEAKHL